MSRPGDTSLLGLLEEAAAGGGVVRFLPDQPEPVPFARIWRRSGAAARWARARFGGSGGRLAVLLTSGPDCLAALLGAWRSGQVVISLPLPGRGMSAADYARQLNRCCASSGAELLLVEEAYRGALPPLQVPVLSFEECVRPGPEPSPAGGGAFVQYTSGSTAEPKGVWLSLDAVAANLLAIVATLEPRPGDVACSWLPLSHDMGLIGMCLSSLTAMGKSFAGSGELCLIRPESYAADPGIWLRACSETEATHTAAPAFGYELAARMARRAAHLDLSRLRSCVVGAEPIRPAVLRGFCEATRPAGFDPRALSPAYGLAEASVAVTLLPPQTTWSARDLDPVALAGGHVKPARQGRARELVACGPPVPGVEIRIAGADEVGAIQVRGPSLLSGYLPGGGRPVCEDGWFTTSDLGFLRGGQLYVAGRSDDVVVVRGRNLYAADVEAALAGHRDLRPGMVTVVGAEGGGYTVLVETRTRPADPAGLALDIDDRLVARLGAGPCAVVVVRRGALPMTASGKIARGRAQALLDGCQLAQLATVELRPGRNAG